MLCNRGGCTHLTNEEYNRFGSIIYYLECEECGEEMEYEKVL